MPDNSKKKDFIATQLAMTKQFEGTGKGRPFYVYDDTKGIPTIGYGINLEDPGNIKYLQNKGYKVKDLLSGKIPINPKHAEEFTLDKLNSLYDDFNSNYKGFSKIPEHGQHILVDLQYNMGPEKLKEFKLMNAAFQKGDMKTAAKELKNSEYYGQTKTRAETHYNTLLNPPKPKPQPKPAPAPPAEPGYWEEFMTGYNAPYNEPKTDFNFPTRFMGGLQELFGITDYSALKKPKKAYGGEITKEGKRTRKYGPRPNYMNTNPSGMTTGPITQRSIGNTPGGGYMSFEDGGETLYDRGPLLQQDVDIYRLKYKPDPYQINRGAAHGITGTPGLEVGYGKRFGNSYLNPYGEVAGGAYYNMAETPDNAGFAGASARVGIDPVFERRVTEYRGEPDYTIGSESSQPFRRIKRKDYWSFNPNVTAGATYSNNLGIEGSPKGQLTPFVSPGMKVAYNYPGQDGNKYVGLFGRAAYSPGYAPKYETGIEGGGDILPIDTKFSVYAGVRPDFSTDSFKMAPTFGGTARYFFNGGEGPASKKSIYHKRSKKAKGGWVYPTNTAFPQYADGGFVTWEIVEDRPKAELGLLTGFPGMDTGVQRVDAANVARQPYISPTQIAANKKAALEERERQIASGQGTERFLGMVDIPVQYSNIEQENAKNLANKKLQAEVVQPNVYSNLAEVGLLGVGTGLLKGASKAPSFTTNLNLERVTNKPRIRKAPLWKDSENITENLQFERAGRGLTEENKFENRIIARVNSKNSPSQSIDLKGATLDDGQQVYYFSANLHNPLEAGRAFKRLEQEIPKGSLIYEPSSLSLDSFKALLKRTQDSNKFKVYPGQHVPLNTASIHNKFPKDVNLLTKLEDHPGIAYFETREEAMKVADQVNKNLPAKFRTVKARIKQTDYENKPAFKVEVPNFKLEKLYKKGGWVGYPDHTMYSSGMERFDRVRNYTKYKQGGSVTWQIID